SARAFADAAEISPQAARAALRKALAGRPWRGQSLRVRRTGSRGGKAGRASGVTRPSLPQNVRGAATPETFAPTTVRNSDEYALAKLSALDAVLAQAAGSASRRLAVQRAASDVLV